MPFGCHRAFQRSGLGDLPFCQTLLINFKGGYFLLQS
jgi:hypothetical protein